LDQGVRTVQNSAAAQGMLHSEATLKAIQDRGQQLGNLGFDQYYNRLLGVVGLGQNAAAGVGNNGLQTANSVANGAAGIAQTQASAGSAQANAYGTAFQGVGNTVNGYMNNSMYGQARQNALYGGPSTRDDAVGQPSYETLAGWGTGG
jgi:hypothetical protein